MNTETGEVFRNLTEKELKERLAKGEPLVPVSEKVARAQEIGIGILNRKERRKAAKLAKQIVKKQKELQDAENRKNNRNQ